METDKYFGLSKRIARWKEPSEFESMLSIAAENNPIAKKLYIEYYRHLNEDYYKRGQFIAQKLIEQNHSDLKGIDSETLYEDMVYCLHKYGLSFQDYIVYDLYNKSEYCRSQFVSDKLRYYYYDILNAPYVDNMLTDKYICYQEYGVFYKRDVVPVIKPNDKSQFLKFTEKNKHFIFKPLKDHSGHGVTLVKTNSIDPNIWFDQVISETPGVAEEVIIQGAELNKINPCSVNTCRIVTFTINNEVIIIGGALRMGVGESITDNAGSGGIFASINTTNGILQSDAKNYHNVHYFAHPTTKQQIIGYELPKWNEAIELTKMMATHKKGTTLISWDIAYSEKGWCMVEANANGIWDLMQSNLQIGLKQDLYDLMDKYFEFIKRNPEKI
ncbi:MAG: hypothetical protein K2L45_07355 [Muribaculaceae bacterium]|nr:hypothetical protein [Muribaculaceae bacterium]